ncbi:unnamed protein product [Clonostachys rhizophaga]|uniref:Sphingoid long-chain base transporter RSB1 n=1 Tax=Clonostachys rhizophaga TaxID=160324 RepID=A0A9N9YNE6_9HYPO|nr:unnamed protein product [Clonostachys rhizophaga]
MSSTDDCSIESCAVELSLYGYRPNLGTNVFLTAIYSLVISTAVIIILRQHLHYIRKYLGTGGYAERIKGYSNPFALDGFTIQYALLTIAPAFITAAIYISIGKLAQKMGRGCLNIRPSLYPRIFIPCDVVILAVQATGGALTTSQTSTPEEAANYKDGKPPGVIITIVGLVLQVVSLTVFLVLFSAILLGQTKSRRLSEAKSEEPTAWTNSTRLSMFIYSLAISCILVLVRSAYRVAELSNGLDSGLAQNERLFIGLDGILIALATVLLIAFHPVYLLKV